MNFDMNFTNDEENIFKKASSDERMIKYNDFFKKQVILSLIF